MAKKIDIFDSTLRDGAQGEGIAFSVADKIGIVKVLDNIGVAYIEAGNPGSNPKDLEFFELIKKTQIKTSKLCAFGSTRRCNVTVQEDSNVISLLTADTPVVAIFGKCWDMHVQKVLKTTLEENLAMIKDTITFFKEKGKEVVFDAEHFFDGCKANEEYAFAALNAASEGGADVLCLCDTNGAAYPTEVLELTQKVIQRFKRQVAIHCHNDTGLSTANSLFSVDAGATQVQGTFVGFGERCGNANLSTIIPNLQLKRGYECIPEQNLVLLSSVARTISEIANLPLPTSLPYVGSSAFAHKGGMHIDGVSKISSSFEHIDPDVVGNERRFLMSEVSGRTTILAAINKIDPTLKKDSPQAMAVINRIKELEHFGYQFEAAQSSVELLIRKELGSYKPFFELEQYKIMGEQPSENPSHCATAMIKINVDGKTEITAAQGDGPVHALDTAMKKALVTFYPVLASVHLTDYKVRVMEPRAAAAAKVRVLIESSDGEHVWSNVGVSTDIIEASWLALVDSIEYKLTRDFECRLGKIWG